MSTNAQSQLNDVSKLDRFVSEVIADLKAGKLKLPMLPRVAFKVRQTLSDEKSSSDDVARIIGTEPALSARLLQVVNSPLYRGSMVIENIPMAVTRLGRNCIRTIVISVMVKQLYEIKDAKLRRTLKRLWLHSTEVAAIARVLARNCTALDPDEAMLAGLVHDIGVLPVISKAEQHPELAHDRALLDVVSYRLHQAVGKLVLQSWKLPQTLVDVAAQHENWRYDSHQGNLVDVVIVANLLGRAGEAHPLADVKWSEVPAYRKIGLDAEESLSLLPEATEELSQVKSLFR